jgi:hypothetical protein
VATTQKLDVKEVCNVTDGKTSRSIRQLIVNRKSTYDACSSFKTKRCSAVFLTTNAEHNIMINVRLASSICKGGPDLQRNTPEERENLTHVDPANQLMYLQNE